MLLQGVALNWLAHGSHVYDGSRYAYTQHVVPYIACGSTLNPKAKPDHMPHTIMGMSQCVTQLQMQQAQQS